MLSLAKLFGAATFCLCGTMATAASANAPAFPSRPITMVVPSTPGGAVDVSARILQARMSELLGQPIVIENRAGVGGHLGSAVAAKAPADGYTILATAGSTLLSGVYQNLSYKPTVDLVPVGMFATASFILVVPATSPFRTVADLIAFAKAHPGKLSFGSTGTGNSTHISGEMLNVMAGIKTTHVPYKGSAGALQDLIGGRIDLMFDNKASCLPHIKSGTLRALAVTSSVRSRDLPNLPAMSETLPGFQMDGWLGFFVPKGTDKAIINRLTAALKSAVADPVVASRLSDLVGEARYMPPTELLPYMREDQARLRRVVEASHITVN